MLHVCMWQPGQGGGTKKTCVPPGRRIYLCITSYSNHRDSVFKSPGKKDTCITIYGTYIHHASHIYTQCENVPPNAFRINKYEHPNYNFVLKKKKSKTPISYNNTNAIICKQKNELHTVLPRRLYCLLRIELIKDLFCFHNLVV